jgi:cobalt-precorrin 5A hydrolase
MIDPVLAPDCYLGLGHGSGATLSDLRLLAERSLAAAGRRPGDIAALASLDARAADGLVTALGRQWALPVLYFSAARLEAETPRLKNPSAAVFRQLGCHGVAEAAALAAAGPAAELILPKIAGNRVTCAIARRVAAGG